MKTRLYEDFASAVSKVKPGKGEVKEPEKDLMKELVTGSPWARAWLEDRLLGKNLRTSDGENFRIVKVDFTDGYDHPKRRRWRIWRFDTTQQRDTYQNLMPKDILTLVNTGTVKAMAPNYYVSREFKLV